MSYKQDLEKQLKGLPQELRIAFAPRSALRVLPLLAANENKGQAFGYWQEQDKARHLLAILTAARVAFGHTIVHHLATDVAASVLAAALDGAIR